MHDDLLERQIACHIASLALFSDSILDTASRKLSQEATS